MLLPHPAPLAVLLRDSPRHEARQVQESQRADAPNEVHYAQYYNNG